MSSITNNNWYNLNSTRKYPIDDGCTGIDDSGNVFPATLITDLNIRMPKSLGIGAMLSSMVVTDSLVSLTFMAIDHPVNNSTYDPPISSGVVFSPLCAFNLKKPITIGVPYVLVPFSDGVAGWVVFGEGINKKINARFSTPAQSAIIPRLCRYYRDFPVSSIGKQASSVKLTGIVQLIEGKDVSITKETVTINDEEKTAIVFRLKEQNNKNILKEYVGPCSGRPESGTCGKPAVEFINTTGPDCFGNININFMPPFETAVYTETIEGTEIAKGGISVDYPIGQIDACTAKDNLPGPDGKLPNTYDDLGPSSSSGDGGPDDNIGSTEPILPLPIEISSATFNYLELPVNITFAVGSQGLWQVINGQFSYVTISGSRKYKALDLSNKNISLWYNSGYDTNLGTRVTTELKFLENGIFGNAGLVLNYRTNAQNITDEYFIVEINRRNASLNIKRFNGLSTISLASATGLEIKEDVWYKIVADIEEGATPVKTRITAKLYSVPENNLIATIATETTFYLPANGKIGLTSEKSEALFSYLQMGTL